MAGWHDGARVSLFQPFVAWPRREAIAARQAGDRNAVPRFLVAARPVDSDELLGVIELSGRLRPERVAAIVIAGDNPGGGLRAAAETLQLAVRYVVDLHVTHSGRPPPDEYLQP
jgi:hypothetical protein